MALVTIIAGKVEKFYNRKVSEIRGIRRAL
jgi:hypothetical protein